MVLGQAEKKEGKVQQTFKDTRVINAHSVETLKKGILDFRIGHRFGDVSGGWRTLWGLENAADVIFEFDYGVTDNLMVGVMRAKGGGPLTQNVSSFFKYKLITQAYGKSPVSVALVGLGSYSTMATNPRPGTLTSFDNTAHRLSYNVQLLLASKVSERLAFQFSVGSIYRNLVETDDTNNLLNLGIVLKYSFSKSFGLIVDTTIPFSEFRSNAVDQQGEKIYYNPFGIGMEWETGGGHVFQVNLTNATGIVETVYIPYTQSSWSGGGYRLGFTISRQFRL